MATSSFLALQNLKIPTPHLSVVFDQAVMTVGITTCYKCQMLMVVLQSKLHVLCILPRAGRAVGPSTGCFPVGDGVVWGSRTIPRASTWTLPKYLFTA